MKLFDSNIPLYAALDQDADKKLIARQLLAAGVLNGDACVTVQVLREVANCLIKKSSLAIDEIMSVIAWLKKLWVIVDTEDMVSAAIDIKCRYGLQFYDACIVAAAKSAHCLEIYSEDMSDGQVYDGVSIINPFSTH